MTYEQHFTELSKGGYYIPGGCLVPVAFTNLIAFHSGWKTIINARIIYLLRRGRRNEALMLSRIEPE